MFLEIRKKVEEKDPEAWSRHVRKAAAHHHKHAAKLFVGARADEAAAVIETLVLAEEVRAAAEHAHGIIAHDHALRTERRRFEECEGLRALRAARRLTLKVFSSCSTDMAARSAAWPLKMPSATPARESTRPASRRRPALRQRQPPAWPPQERAPLPERPPLLARAPLLVEQLTQEITPQGRATVPDEVKAELLTRIRRFVEEQAV